MILGIVLISAFLFGLGYLFYARYLEKALRIDMSEQTPAHTMRDGIDYDPAPRMVLFGHHFSAIAGSGPIVGPIVAGLAFGWGPALLWILVGCILLGAPHDFSCLIASVRNKGKSLGEIAKHFLGGFAYKVFLWFLFVVMIYVLSVFVDLTASTFVPPTKESSLQGGMVATSSLIYIFLAVGFGYILRHFKVSAGKLSWIFVPLIFISIWVSSYIPLTPELVSKLGFNPHILWISVLLIYCAFASILPVWILLQPRDYLSAFLLYACLLIGFIGILFSGFMGDISIQYPIFLGFNSPELGPLFPVLFVTIACGAISGFHSLVATGTTSKQLDKMADARPVGYGAMLLEGILGVLALSTVMVCAKNPGVAPTIVFAEGIGNFISVLGLNPTFVSAFALLAVSTFLLTTLDAGTRLTRFVFQEIFGLSNNLRVRVFSSIIVVLIPALAIFCNTSDQPFWQAIWPAFGATNQLLAAFAAFFVYLWKRQMGKPTLFISVPMVVMFIITISAMIDQVYRGMIAEKPNYLVSAVLICILCMTAAILFDAIRKVFQDLKQRNNK